MKRYANWEIHDAFVNDPIDRAQDFYLASEADEVIAFERMTVKTVAGQRDIVEKQLAARDKTIEGLKEMVHECFLQSCPDYTAHLGQLYSVEELDRLWRQSDMKATLDSILGPHADSPATPASSQTVKECLERSGYEIVSEQDGILRVYGHSAGEGEKG